MHISKSRIQTFTAALAISATLALNPFPTLASGVSSTDTHKGKLPQSMNNVCKMEGSNNCYWNAKERGNKTGLDYVVRAFPHQNIVCVMYVSAKWKHDDYCLGKNGERLTTVK